MSGSPVLELPASAPRIGGSLSRRLARFALRLGGWKMVGAFPDVAKAVVIAAPHSSGWDAVWALLVRAAMDLDVGFLAKKELFVGPLGWLLRKVGGLPTDRRTPGKLVDDVAARFRAAERMWLAIAPEGTRRRVDHWKTGFWRIAHAADVPIICAYFHYPEKIIGIGAVFRTSDDMDGDIARIRDWYRPWQGKNRSCQ